MSYDYEDDFISTVQKEIISFNPNSFNKMIDTSLNLFNELTDPPIDTNDIEDIKGCALIIIKTLIEIYEDGYECGSDDTFNMIKNFDD